MPDPDADRDQDGEQYQDAVSLPSSTTSARPYAAPDPWEPWPNAEPQLRADSFTARLLCYLTPRTVHYETRRILIGDFPEGWIERNCPDWWALVQRKMNQHLSDEGEGALGTPTFDVNTDPVAQTESTVGHAANNVLPEIIAHAPRPPPIDASKVMHKSASTAYGVRDLDIVQDITHATHMRQRLHHSHRSTFAAKMRRRRAHLRHRKLRDAPLETIGGEQIARADTHETASTVTAAAELSNVSPETQDAELSRTPPVEAPTKPANLAEHDDHPRGTPPPPRAILSTLNPQSDSGASSLISSDRTRVPASISSTSLNTAADTLNTVYFDCPEPEASNQTAFAATAATDTTSAPVSRRPSLKGAPGSAGQTAGKSAAKAPKPLVAIADEPTVSVYPRQDSDSADDTENALDEERPEALSAPPSEDEESVVSNARSSVSNRFSDLRRLGKMRLTNHRTRNLIYQGRFLAEVRESTSPKPIISETEAPLATTLVSRWKEYAVFAKYTGDIRKPLCLYFYDAIKDKKLTRRSQRVWSRSLDFKIVLDPQYELKIFSPLDMTMALWKPHFNFRHSTHGGDHERKKHSKKFKKKGGEHVPHKHRTRVLILHSQSINSMWDLSFLIASVVQSAQIYSNRVVNVAVPSFDVEVQLAVSSEIYRDAGIKPATMTYAELKKPLVSTSPIVNAIMNKVGSAVHSLPRRFQISTTDTGSKYALAWQHGPRAHRQLWVPGTSSMNFFLSRLFWLMRPCGTLHLLVPEPRCYEGDLIEPAPIEGFCTLVDTGKPGKGRNLTGKFGTQYLFTNDHFLFHVPGASALLPMLASGQHTVEKDIDPFPLTESHDISWIASSTCLREIDFRDAIARVEMERRVDMITSSHGLIDLRHVENVVTDGTVPGQLTMHRGADCLYKFQFESQEVAESWAKHLKELAKYWQAVRTSRLVHHASGTAKSIGISPFVKNRPILYSGPVYFKKHRFTTFRQYSVVLTAKGLVVFTLSGSTHVRDPNAPAPASAYDYRRYTTYSLEHSYIYTGQLARHALLNEDKHIDPSNPGVRALPRAHENSWVSQDTELDRCFVIWRPHRSHLDRLSMRRDIGSYLIFLARDKHERDNWVTAIRYVQTELALKTKEILVSDDFGDDSVFDLNLDTSSNILKKARTDTSTGKSSDFYTSTTSSMS